MNGTVRPSSKRPLPLEGGGGDRRLQEITS